MTITPRQLATAAGVLFAVTAAVDIPYAQNTEGFQVLLDYLLEALFCLSIAAGAATLWLLRGQAANRSARVGLSIPAAGYSLLTLVTAATAVAGKDVLGPLFLLGLLLVVLGSLAVAVLDLRRRLVPRWAGVALLAGVVAMALLGEGYGLLAWSAGWFAVAAVQRQSAVTTTSTRWNSLSSV